MSLRELSFLPGGPESFGMVKGGSSFFSVGLRGDQNFLRVKEGGTKFFSPKISCLFGAKAKGGTSIFPCRQRGDQIFFFLHIQRGDQKKIGRPSRSLKENPG